MKRAGLIALLMLSYLAFPAHAGRLIDERTVKRPVAAVPTVVIGEHGASSLQPLPKAAQVVMVVGPGAQGGPASAPCDADDVIRALFSEGCAEAR